MCGRMFQTLPLGRLLQIARTTNVANEELHTSSYNVCPTTYIPVIRNSPLYERTEEQKETQNKLSQIKQANEEQDPVEEPEKYENREVSFMKWGAQTNFNMLINGRIEELSSKKTFMNIIQNRCVVIMEGYYEWQQKPQQKQKQPFCFKSKNQDHFLVAGLFTPNNEIIILTKDAIPSTSHIHERMPVILSQKEVQMWLDPKNTQNINTIINKSLLNKEKSIWKNIGFAQVAPYVNKINEKSIKCMMSLDDYKKQLSKTGIMKFLKKKPETVQKMDKDGQIVEEKLGIQSRDEENEKQRKLPSVLQSDEKIKKHEKDKNDKIE